MQPGVGHTVTLVFRDMEFQDRGEALLGLSYSAFVADYATGHQDIEDSWDTVEN